MFFVTPMFFFTQKEIPCFWTLVLSFPWFQWLPQICGGCDGHGWGTVLHQLIRYWGHMNAANAFVLPWDFGRITYVWTNSFALLSSFIYNICPTTRRHFKRHDAPWYPMVDAISVEAHGIERSSKRPVSFESNFCAHPLISPLLPAKSHFCCEWS